MTTWIRSTPRGGLERLTVPWHIEGEPNARISSHRGVCGENLGAVVDRYPLADPLDEPDLGDRCTSCQGMQARGDA